MAGHLAGTASIAKARTADRAVEKENTSHAATPSLGERCGKRARDSWRGTATPTRTAKAPRANGAITDVVPWSAARPVPGAVRPPRSGASGQRTGSAPPRGHRPHRAPTQADRRRTRRGCVRASSARPCLLLPGQGSLAMEVVHHGHHCRVRDVPVGVQVVDHLADGAGRFHDHSRSITIASRSPNPRIATNASPSSPSCLGWYTAAMKRCVTGPGRRACVRRSAESDGIDGGGSSPAGDPGSDDLHRGAKSRPPHGDDAPPSARLQSNMASKKTSPTATSPSRPAVVGDQRRRAEPRGQRTLRRPRLRLVRVQVHRQGLAHS